MDFSEKVKKAIQRATETASDLRHEYVTPEHLLKALTNDETFAMSLMFSDIDLTSLKHQVDDFISSIEPVPAAANYSLVASDQVAEMLSYAERQARGAEKDIINVPLIIDAMLHLDDSYAGFMLRSNTSCSDAEIVYNVIMAYENAEDDGIEEEDEDQQSQQSAALPSWHSLVTCINDSLPSHNPLIGRQQELDRTVQVLCRKDKNNPLHIGEAGVGKTAIVYGLAAMIERGEVPDRLLHHRIYSIDLGTLIAGTQFRGDFEKRIKTIMDGVRSEGNAIIYIDEIHNLVGAGRGGDGSMDASNMLKPYLEAGDIRFIGSTTYQEYNRYLAKSKGIVRRFQQIDIAEPSVDEATEILLGLRSHYEQFHSVTIPDDTIRYAVEMSARHVADRFLPDKAIDLIDEASAYLHIHPLTAKDGRRKAVRYQKVDRRLINDILAKVCRIDAKALRDEDNSALQTLDADLKSAIYGQDAAISNVVSAVQMSKAGLLDDNKPIASLLFVGPTGVGKTEVARVLAQQLGIELVRFDMSEYTEKHTVAKLIGSPAGYVGYEDGGLLTDAIRKSPNCVLLLDEIEKAHSDIYNILLQVMDYARLTDNKGQKADFTNVLLIMTSNAGAQYAGQANMGFAGKVSKGEAMLQQVRRIFKPEFINRLTATVVFNEMDRRMAQLILDKKLRQLDAKLQSKHVTLTLTADARDYLLRQGFTQQYGAREIDRTLQRYLNPILTREILFGSLRKGGSITIDKALLTDHDIQA